MGPGHVLRSPRSHTVSPTGIKLCRCSQPGQKGVLIRRIEPTLPACDQLCKGDVMLSFEGTQIGNDGTVAFRSGERINFSYLVSEKQNHEDVREQAQAPARSVPTFVVGPWHTLHGEQAMT